MDSWINRRIDRWIYIYIYIKSLILVSGCWKKNVLLINALTNMI